MNTFLLVHGAWESGWVWQSVTSLLEKAGHKVSIVARGPHLKAIKQNGLKLVTANNELVVKLEAQETVPDEPQDYVFITVKSTGLQPLLMDLKKLADNGANIIPAMNGLVDRIVPEEERNYNTFEVWKNQFW